MRVISLTNASSVVEPGTGTVHDAGPDGVFDLPHAFAVELVTRHASQWRGESEHEAAAAAARLSELRNPRVLSGTVADHGGRLARAEARIEELSGTVADLTARIAAFDTPAGAEQGDAGDSAGDATDEDPQNEDTGQADTEAKPPRSRKTAAKNTAAKSPPE